MTRGLLLTFEGVEGSGKSTQIGILAERLSAFGVDVTVTREPGGTELGVRLRTVLLTPGTPVVPRAELLLYAADRAQHLAEVIEPAIARGATVLCDRYLDATLAYQGFGRGLGVEAVLEVHRGEPPTRRPDRTVLLDADPEEGLRRARERDARSGSAAREDRFEREALDFHHRVRDGYLELARREPERIRVVPASGEPGEVARRVWASVEDLFALAGRRS